ncbi:hypothetical protein ABK040_006811 [Willaertia magna]
MFDPTAHTRSSFHPQQPIDNTSDYEEEEDEEEMSPTTNNNETHPYGDIGYDEQQDNTQQHQYYYNDIFSGDDDFENTPAESRISNPYTSTVAEKAKQKVLLMMKKMGYKQGEGLGKHGQGSTSALEPTTNQGRGGLGSNNNNSGGVNAHYTSNLPEHFTIQRHEPDLTDYPHREDVHWLTSDDNNINDNSSIYNIVRSDNTTLDLSFSQSNGQKYIEMNLSPFCNTQLVHQIFELKTQFDGVEDKLFNDARYRSNPYERIGRSIFQNRAAIKLANIDRISNLTSEDGLPRLPEENGILYFADICAGPGGFTEYLYYRYKTEKAKGWGFTLKSKKDDWKLNRFNPESPHDNFEVYYGEDGTGDITKNENIRALSKLIDQGTNGRGVALVTGDGGFSVHGVENSQEYLTHQLVLCQMITALMILRKGGAFVCKLFDLNTWFSCSLMFILHQNFDNMTIVKPFSSRPANSERYVICKGLKKRQPSILNYLFDANIKLSNRENIKSLVDCSVMENDEKFSTFMRESNDRIASGQVSFLQKIKNAVEDKYLEIQEKQNKMRDLCLQEWNLPNPQKVKDGKPKRKRNDGDGGNKQQKSNYYAPSNY